MNTTPTTPEPWSAGDRARMADLRTATVTDVTVEEVSERHAIVRDDSGKRYRVGLGFLTKALALAALIALGACGGGDASPGYRAALHEVRTIRATLGADHWRSFCAEMTARPVPATISDRSIGAATEGTPRWTAREMAAALRSECGR